MSDDIERMSGRFFVSAGHSHPETLADGRTVVPGQTVGAVPAADKRLIDEGILIEDESTRVAPTEAAQERADAYGIDTNAIKGTGQDGRVTVDDVNAAIEERDDNEEDDNG